MFHIRVAGRRIAIESKGYGFFFKWHGVVHFVDTVEDLFSTLKTVIYS